MSRAAARLFPILALAAILAATLLLAAWRTCLFAATSSAAGPDAPPFLGITYLEMTAQAAAHHPGCIEGALVTAVKAGGAGGLAGLRIGDTVVGIGGRPLGSDWTLLQGLLDRQADEQVMVSVRRGDITMTLPVTLATLP